MEVTMSDTKRTFTFEGETFDGADAELIQRQHQCADAQYNDQDTNEDH